MPCKACRSGNLGKFPGELTVSFSQMKDVEALPIYVCQEVVVCLDCGFAELVILQQELELLKKGNSRPRS